MSYYIGVDNGVSGSISVVNELGALVHYEPTPIARCLNYTKARQWVNRVNHRELGVLLERFKDGAKCAMERPMIMPARFKATVSAIRALESTQIVLETLQIPYEFVDSREWQRKLLPSGLHGDELKVASNEVCRRMFPGVTLKKPGDGDSLLIAEHLRRKEMGR